jgi:hypothetical protein
VVVDLLKKLTKLVTYKHRAHFDKDKMLGHMKAVATIVTHARALALRHGGASKVRAEALY